MFIGSSYFFSVTDQKNAYILHSLGLLFSMIGIGYYFIQVGNIRSVLELSTLFFFESILLFLSYVRLKK